MTTRNRELPPKDGATFFYVLAYITLALFAYGVVQDMEFSQTAAMYVAYN